jgi:hypothetical protein
MNSHIKFLQVLFCIAAFIKAANAADVLIDTLDATMAETGSSNGYKPGLAEPGSEGMLILKFEEERQDKTFGHNEKFTVGEFPKSTAVLLTGLFLVGISIIGKNNFLKK